MEAWQSGLLRPTYNRLIGSHLCRKHPIRWFESNRLLHPPKASKSNPFYQGSASHKTRTIVKILLFTFAVLTSIPKFRVSSETPTFLLFLEF